MQVEVLECFFSAIITLIGGELIKMAGPMTESGLATILEGVGYHAFRGPRPVARVMLTGNAI